MYDRRQSEAKDEGHAEIKDPRSDLVQYGSRRLCGGKFVVWVNCFDGLKLSEPLKLIFTSSEMAINYGRKIHEPSLTGKTDEYVSSIAITYLSSRFLVLLTLLTSSCI